MTMEFEMSTSLLQTYPISLHACKLAKKEDKLTWRWANNSSVLTMECEMGTSLLQAYPISLHACKLAMECEKRDG